MGEERMRRRSRQNVPRAVRTFTDREEPRAAFWKKYDQFAAELQQGDDYIHVLTYYGIGGIGKTSLLKKLTAEMDEKIQKPRYLYFDFNLHQECRAVLNKIKNRLEEEYGYTFPLFDIANYVYAKKIGEKGDSLEVQQLTERSPLLSMMMSVAGNIPILGIATQVLSLADQGVALVRSYLKQHSRELKQIEYLEAEELYRQMPILFAEDMALNLEEETVPFVFFLDTYERVVNELSQLGEPLKNDAWLRGEDGLVLNMPGTLWVIAGREKLKWERFDSGWSRSMEQHILGDLSAADSELFLKSAGIAGRELRDALYELTGGTPVYLDFCVDQYRCILSRGEIPKAEMFGKNTFELIERFDRYMDAAQKDLAFLLSCLKLWDDGLIQEIGGKILPNFSIYTYDKVKDFSFVIQSDDGCYNIHQTVGDVLFGVCPQILKVRVADCLMERFRKTLESCACFEPGYALALDYVLRAAMMKYPDTEQFREYYEENLLQPIKRLAAAGRFDQAEVLFDAVQSLCQQDTQSRLKALCMLNQSYLQYLRGIYDPNATQAFAAYEMYCALLGEEHPDSLRALGMASDFLSVSGSVQRALEIDRQVYEKRRVTLEEDHPDTIDALAKLSISLSYSGDEISALELKREALERYRMKYGEEDLKTQKAMGNLASTLLALGYYCEALELNEKVLEFRKSTLGEDHLSTLITMYNLAITLETMGDHKRALEIKETVLEKRRAILGEGHPHTLNSMNSLAITLSSMGEFRQALELYGKVVEERSRIFGREHPDTLTAMCNYSSALGKMGKQQEALEYLEDTLRQLTSALSEEHKTTISAKYSLAVAHWNYGDQARARELQETVWEKRQEMLGEDHDETLDAMHSYAVCLEATGEYAKSLEIMEEVLRRRIRIFGEDHPETLLVQSNIGSLHWHMGNKAYAQELEEKVLEKERVILGEKHPNTLAAMSNCAFYLEEAEEYGKAVDLRESVLQQRITALGENHPKTIDAMRSLVHTYYCAEDVEHACALLEEVLAKQRIILGEDHEDITAILHDLSVMYENLDDFEQALATKEEVLARCHRLLGEDHPDSIKAVRAHIALKWRMSKNEPESEAQVLEDCRSALGEDDLMTVKIAGYLASTLISHERLDEALVLRKEVVEKYRRLLGEDHKDTREAILSLRTLEVQMDIGVADLSDFFTDEEA